MILKEHIGKHLNVTLRTTMPVTIKGLLTECDEIIICLDQGDGKPNLFVPLTSILHIETVQQK